MNQQVSGNLVDTTDCLEAISVFRCWKNFLFIIVLLCLLLLQGLFWINNLGLVKTSEQALSETSASPAGANNSAGIVLQVSGANQAGGVAEQQKAGHWFAHFAPGPKQVRALIRIVNFILIPAACLYCLTMLFALKVSMVGRLGGINHIARAFFLSLIFFILLLPWQLLFAPMLRGVMFTASELVSCCAADKTLWAQVFFYGRFTAYWLIALLFFLFAQIRSIRWAKATLKRLEVV